MNATNVTVEEEVPTNRVVFGNARRITSVRGNNSTHDPSSNRFVADGVHPLGLEHAGGRS